MSRFSDALRPGLILVCGSCAWCLACAGCLDQSTSASLPRTGAAAPPAVPAATEAEEIATPAGLANVASDGGGSVTVAVAEVEEADPVADPVTGADETPQKPAAERPAASQAVASRDRVFSPEGPQGALRIGFDDLDLLKLLRMDPVTADCVEKMPRWLRNLEGKAVRIRGYMKPSLLTTQIPQFRLVRDTGLCCFGPKGQIYDMIVVSLKEGTTTDYIELKPFDVVGTFRIEVVTLEDDGMIFGLYYLDDATIIQK